MFRWLPAHLRNQREFNEKGFLSRYSNGRNEGTVLNTGGADGIGLAFAKKFAKLGFNLILTDLSEDKLRRRQREL